MMKDRYRNSVLFGSLLLALLAVVDVQAAESSLIAFELEDTAQKLHDGSDWRNRNVLLFISDRASVVHNENYVWSAPVVEFVKKNASDDAFALARIFDARGFPRLVRGMVRRAARDPDNPVSLGLLDWEGEFPQRYALQPAAYHMLVFDRSHTLVFSEALQDFDPERLAGILARLETLLP